MTFQNCAKILPSTWTSSIVASLKGAFVEEKPMTEKRSFHSAQWLFVFCFDLALVIQITLTILTFDFTHAQYKT